MTQAEDNRVSERLIAPPRGRIIDRFGVELANNRRNYRVLLVAEQATGGVEAALDTIGKVIVLPPQQKKRVLRDIAQNKKFVPVPVAENLTWEEFAPLNLHLPYLPGVQPDVGETRDYPLRPGACRTCWAMSRRSRPDDTKNDDDPLLDLPGFRIGKRGIEKAFDSELRGTAGASRVSRSTPMAASSANSASEAGAPGKDVYLTIDRDLQQFADAATGRRKRGLRRHGRAPTAMSWRCPRRRASIPIFSMSASSDDQWHALTTDDHKPLLNKAIAGAYPPGSTFKPAMALAAVDNGHCDDLQRQLHGLDSARQSRLPLLEEAAATAMSICTAASSTPATSSSTKWRGGSASTRWKRPPAPLGLGAPTRYRASRRACRLHSRAAPGSWRSSAFPGSRAKRSITGIGQGYVLATPIQLCTLAARIASGKAVVAAHRRMKSAQRCSRASAPAPLPISDEALPAVRPGMNAVTNEPGGTAFALAHHRSPASRWRARRARRRCAASSQGRTRSAA